MKCSIESCANLSRARGWCMHHFNNWYRRGDPLTVGKIGREKVHGFSKPTAGQKGGGLGHQTWRAWRGMIQRCRNQNHKSYAGYGGRGIIVCPEWFAFDTFLTDMGVKPEGATLGRIDNDLGYSAKNCEWQTWTQQARNRRNSRVLTFNGETLTLQEWSERIGITFTSLWRRLHAGWEVDEALTRPARRQKNSRSLWTS